MSNYVESGEWSLQSITIERNVKYYPCCPRKILILKYSLKNSFKFLNSKEEGYPDITFHLLLRRKTIFYLINIILPMIWLSFLSLLVFCIPPESGIALTYSDL